MSIKARIIYAILFMTPNVIGNNIGSALIATMGLALPWLVIIPALSRKTKIDLLHNKIIEKFGGDNIANIKEPTIKTKSNDSISEDVHTDNVTEQTSAEETTTDKTVKDLIMSAVDGALKEFIANPPDEAYEGTSGYFSWYINLYDSDYERLTDKSGDDFCVNCDIGLLEEVIMNQTGDFSEVESDVKTTFESYLSQSDEQILQKDSSIIDITKSHFEIAVFEVEHDGADVWRYYREQHSFLNCVDSGMSGRDRALEIAATDRSQFSKLEDKYKNDKEIAMVAIENDPASFEYVSDNLKNDKEVAMAAITRIGWALYDASDDLKNDREIVMAAVSTDGAAIEYAPEDLKNDREIVMAAVSNSGTAIEHLSDNFKNDKEVVMTAASNGISWALELVSDELKNDKDVVMAAVKDDPDALEHASDSLKSDKDILELIKASH